MKTLADYNADAAEGEDRRFHKNSEWIKRLDKGPWAAFDISFHRSNYVFVTLGGIKTNIDGEALDQRANPIPGLYVVGARAAHIPRRQELRERAEPRAGILLRSSGWPARGGSALGAVEKNS